MTTPLQKAAQAMIDRWESPYWKLAPTADYIAELRKALVDEIAQSVEPVAWIKLNDDGRTGALFHQNEGWKDASELVPLYLHPPQPQATTPKSAHLSDFDMRGVLASNLLCWKRLTEAEAQDLVCFFEKVRTAQGEKL